MRRIQPIAGVIFLLLLATSIINAAPIWVVANPGFEQGFYRWQQQNCDIIGPPRFPDSGRNGTHMAVLGAGDTLGGNIRQSIRLPFGTYDLHFDYGSIGDPGRVAVMRVDVLQGGEVLASQTFTNTNPQQDYFISPEAITLETLHFTTCSSKAVVIRFSDLSPDSGIAVDPAIDNVEIVRQGEIRPRPYYQLR